MNDTYFRINIIDAAIHICQRKTNYPSASIDEIIRYSKNGPAIWANYDYDRAKSLGQLVGWELFNKQGTRKEILQHILMELAIELKPFWMRICHLGRSKVKQVLNKDQLQCFKYAGLLDEELSYDIINWWETLARISRLKDEEQKMHIGKEGELKTLELEKKRLSDLGINKSPKWVSIEDSTAGCDVISYRYRNGEIIETKIEVKAFSLGLLHFYLTRNEWKTALFNRDNYIFHIWDLEKNNLTEVYVDEMQKHVPFDQGDGLWQSVMITLS